MPDLLIRDLVIKILNETDYRTNKITIKGRPSYLFKNYILAMYDDIEIIDENSFEVSIDENDYNEILFTEAKHAINRINRQYEVLKVISNCKELPKAWLLVSTYYHSFYCAILISRLLGRYSCYFDNKEISTIVKSATNTSKSKIDHGNYVGYCIFTPSRGVKIRFKIEGDKPHFTAWKNLHDKLTTKVIKGEVKADRLNRINLFKKIINEHVRSWPQPSDVRNHWNYSDMSLYSEKGDNIARELSTFIDSTRDIEWASRKNLYPEDKNISNSIGFISSTLNRVVRACEAKILG
ncbi:MAG TPA: hypothetical protein PKD55_18825 [Bellilinea sp.]|nr:hypothetical protein [Bellilinea sp.]